MITHQRRRAAAAAAPPSTTSSRITWQGHHFAPRQERTAFPPTSWSSGGRSHSCAVADRLKGYACVEELLVAHPEALKVQQDLTDEDLEVLAAWLSYWGYEPRWYARVLEHKLATAEHALAAANAELEAAKARLAELEGK